MTLLPKKPIKTATWYRHPWPAVFTDLHQEWKRLDQGAGLLDFSALEYVSVSGPDGAAFLQGVTSQDARSIKTGEARNAWILDANGKILFYLRMIRIQEQQFYLQTYPGYAHQILQHLDRYLIMEDATLEVVKDIYCFSVQGPGAEALKESLEGVASPGAPVNHDRCGKGGFDLLLPREHGAEAANTLSALIEPVGMEALNVARVESFIPWFEIDMVPGTNPLIYGKRDALSYTKGCFIGQETIAKTRDRGHPPRLLVQLAGPAGDPSPPGTSLFHQNKNIGAISSAVSSFEKGTSLALAVLKFAVAEQADSVRDDHNQNWTIVERSAFKA